MRLAMGSRSSSLIQDEFCPAEISISQEYSCASYIQVTCKSRASYLQVSCEMADVADFDT